MRCPQALLSTSQPRCCRLTTMWADGPRFKRKEVVGGTACEGACCMMHHDACCTDATRSGPGAGLCPHVHTPGASCRWPVAGGICAAWPVGPPLALPAATWPQASSHMRAGSAAPQFHFGERGTLRANWHMEFSLPDMRGWVAQGSGAGGGAGHCCAVPCWHESHTAAGRPCVLAAVMPVAVA